MLSTRLLSTKEGTPNYIPSPRAQLMCGLTPSVDVLEVKSTQSIFPRSNRNHVTWPEPKGCLFTVIGSQAFPSGTLVTVSGSIRDVFRAELVFIARKADTSSEVQEGS